MRGDKKAGQRVHTLALATLALAPFPSAPGHSSGTPTSSPRSYADCGFTSSSQPEYNANREAAAVISDRSLGNLALLIGVLLEEKAADALADSNARFDVVNSAADVRQKP